ncbi:50S ribosomal protein L18 [Anopheles sinensis]|uniref:50S ribosomal protein L18 n=1 Tax=Anopheles sinensis TaxID=74873 RepID=A0A084VQT2_ANOSI|nr:50S ribosomal protein L18 [Anopheles sinensis]
MSSGIQGAFKHNFPYTGSGEGKHSICCSVNKRLVDEGEETVVSSFSEGRKERKERREAAGAKE